MSKHRLANNRRPGKLQCKSTPHRRTIAQIQRRQWAGQMGGIGVAAAVIAIPLLVGVDAVAGFPIDLASPPSSPTGQRPPGPSWLPGVGAGLHTSGPAFNPLFKSGVLDGGVASQSEVLRAALSLTLPSSDLLSQTPLGHWVGTHWVPTDPFVHPTTPCPSPVLDPIGFRLWFARWFPNVTLPAPPVASVPPAAPVTPPSVPVVAPVAAPVEAESPPPATSLPAQSPPVAEVPTPVTQPVVDTSPVVVDAPPLDVPPVVVDVPVVDVPVVVDVPPVDLPPVEIPPVDVSPVTDPVTTVTDPVVDSLPEPVGDAVDGVTSALAAPAPADVPSQDATTGAAETTVPLAAAVDSVVAPVDGSESSRAAAEQHPTLLDTRATHSTSENGPGSLTWGDSRGRDGSDYVGRHRVDGQRQDRLFGSSLHDSGRTRSDRAVSGDGHRAEGSSRHGGHNAGGKHRRSDDGSDRVKSRSKSESRSESHSSSKSHSSGSHSNGGGSHGGSHGGGHRG